MRLVSGFTAMATGRCHPYVDDGVGDAVDHGDVVGVEVRHVDLVGDGVDGEAVGLAPTGTVWTPCVAPSITVTVLALVRDVDPVGRGFTATPAGEEPHATVVVTLVAPSITVTLSVPVGDVDLVGDGVHRDGGGTGSCRDRGGDGLGQSLTWPSSGARSDRRARPTAGGVVRQAKARQRAEASAPSEAWMEDRPMQANGFSELPRQGRSERHHTPDATGRPTHQSSQPAPRKATENTRSATAPTAGRARG